MLIFGQKSNYLSFDPRNSITPLTVVTSLAIFVSVFELPKIIEYGDKQIFALSRHNVSFGEFCSVFIVKNRTVIHKNWHCVLVTRLFVCAFSKFLALNWPLPIVCQSSAKNSWYELKEGTPKKKLQRSFS